ncbi:MAG: serine hydrolase [Sphingomonadales bacterium]|nr:serine hydrolase [Sphingomonadales bacterium]
MGLLRILRKGAWLAPLCAALAACHGGDAGDAPLSPAALAAVVAQPGVSRIALARAVDALFTTPGLGETRALLVYYRGRLVAERYAAPYDRRTRMQGWSMSKCVTAILIGLMVADGRLRLDQPAPVPLWQRPGDPRGAITLRELLQMRSGLRHRETADTVTDADTVRMLFLDGRDDMAAYAEAQPLTTTPGSAWRYSTASTIVLADIAARALTPSTDPATRQRELSDFLRTRLFDPVGLKSAVAEYDAAGTMIGGSMIEANPRDWGRIGELLRSQGAVRGAQVLPRGWVQFMTEPAPGNPGFGAQLWRNLPQPDGHAVLFPARGPADLFACVGHLGQYILVAPAGQLTLVRLGHSDEAERAALVDKLADIVALFPEH